MSSGNAPRCSGRFLPYGGPFASDPSPGSRRGGGEDAVKVPLLWQEGNISTRIAFSCGAGFTLFSASDRSILREPGSRGTSRGRPPHVLRALLESKVVQHRLLITHAGKTDIH